MKRAVMGRWIGLSALAAIVGAVPVACNALSGLDGLEFVDAGDPVDAGSDAPVDTGSDAPVVLPPEADIPTKTIDFGLADCGGSALGNQVVTVTNTGGSPLDVTATLAGTAFSIVSGASLHIEADASADIVVAPPAVPSSAKAGDATTDTLTVQTNDPNLPSTAIPVSITARGATITLLPTVASFGVQPIGVAVTPIPLVLGNTGNASVDVTFDMPLDTQFGLTTPAPPSTLAPSGTVPGLAATFTPNTIMTSATTAAIHVMGPVCGVSVTEIPMAGQGSNGDLAISTGDISFGPAGDGNVDCGTTAPPKTFTLENKGNQAFSWSSTLGKTSPALYTLTPSSGTVPVGQMVTVTVTPAAMPMTTATTADAFGDVLTITTDVVGDTPHTVDLHQTAHGAVITSDVTALGLGSIPVNSTSPPGTINLGNAGSAPASLTLTKTGAAFSATPLTLSPGPGVSTPVSVTFSPNGVAGPASGDIAIAADPGTVLCQPLPKSIALTGTGLNGSVAFAPSALDFGKVDCGKQGIAKTITFTNSGNQDYTITPSFLKPTPQYTFTMNPATGIVAKLGGSCVVTVTPKAIPGSTSNPLADLTPNAYWDLFTVTTNVAGDTPHVIPLGMSARGAIISFDTATIDFGAVSSIAADSRDFSFSMTNKGNQSIDLVLAGLATPFGGNGIVTVQPFLSTARVLDFKTNMTTTFNDSLTIAVSGANQVLCAPLPSSVNVTGSGQATFVTVPTREVVFPPTKCGSLPVAKTIDVKNSAPQTLTVAATLGKGTASPFTLSPPSAPIASAGFAQFTVNFKGFPTTANTDLNAYTDFVDFTFTGGSRRVFVRMTAQGAVLSLTKSSVQFPATKAGSTFSWGGALHLFNNGNLAATGVGLTLSDTTNFALSPSSGIAANPDGTALDMVFKPLMVGSKSGTVAINPIAGLCAPLPAPTTITGTGN